MIALRHLETYEAFPPMQTPPSYNLAQVMEKIRNQKRAIHNPGHPSD
jgi:arylsulfatase